MNNYKTPKEDLQQFYTLVFGEGKSIAAKAEAMRSGIYKIGGALGVSVVLLALLLLRFTG